MSPPTDTNPVCEDENVWYFAYGSNMSSEKFTKARGIKPLARLSVRIQRWRLTFEVPGMPYSEPGMGAITPFSSSPSPIKTQDGYVKKEIDAKPVLDHQEGMPVHGVAYLVTRKQYISIIYSEGGGIAYGDFELDAEPTSPCVWLAVPSTSGRESPVCISARLRVRAFVAVRSMSRLPPTYPEPLPSKRYMDLLITGAAEAHLPAEYQEYLRNWPIYAPVPKPGEKSTERCSQSTEGQKELELWLYWLTIQAFLLIAIWMLRLGEKLCYATISRDTGLCPRWVQAVVRNLVGAIWGWHDGFMVRFVGPGDGRDQQSQTLKRGDGAEECEYDLKLGLESRRLKDDELEAQIVVIKRGSNGGCVSHRYCVFWGNADW